MGLGLLMLLSLPFMLYSADLGRVGFTLTEPGESRFFVTGQSVGNVAIFGHMMLGGVLMLMTPLQVWPGLRHRFPGFHRWSGRFLCLAAVLTGTGGLLYIGLRGTIGGAWMNLGFALYGGLIVLAAGQAIRHARARAFARHRRWALRLLVLSFGSWFYRVHYGLWYAATDGTASTPAFDGTFDLIQNFAFYVPYLLLLELWLRRQSQVRLSA